MSASDTNRPSETDWKRLDEMTDEEIDTSDIPPLDDSFFAKASLRKPKQVAVTMQADADILEWFRAHGQRYESLVNTLLRNYVEGKKDQHR
jgi:uncharacterized protein (DUF4415 family)